MAISWKLQDLHGKVFIYVAVTGFMHGPIEKQLMLNGSSCVEINK